MSRLKCTEIKMYTVPTSVVPRENPEMYCFWKRSFFFFKFIISCTIFYASLLGTKSLQRQQLLIYLKYNENGMKYTKIISVNFPNFIFFFIYRNTRKTLWNNNEFFKLALIFSETSKFRNYCYLIWIFDAFLQIVWTVSVIIEILDILTL